MANLSSTQKKLGLVIGVLAVFVVIGLGGLVVYLFPTATNQGYAPEQPIPFSHKLHAGDNKIACQYCHTSPEKSRHSTVPALNVCMNCHSVVKVDSPHIQKLREHFKNGTPIEWVRIHELPDYVYFSHKRHLAKGLQCENCHGDVKTMDRVQQFSPLTMGWCMDCHRGLTTPSQVLANTYPDMKNPHGPVAPTNCSTCHN